MDRKLKKGEYLDILLRSKKTVFSTKDVALLWGQKREAAARVRLSSYVKAGKLIHVHRGLYAKDREYDKFELATKLYTPSYVSFETVLAQEGVVFQFYSQIFIASYLTRNVVIDGQTYSYKRIQNPALTNPLGIEDKGEYHVASPERAFLDVVCTNKGYHFDNLLSLDWEKVFEILPIYASNTIKQRVEKYHKSAIR